MFVDNIINIFIDNLTRITDFKTDSSIDQTYKNKWNKTVLQSLLHKK